MRAWISSLEDHVSVCFHFSGDSYMNIRGPNCMSKGKGRVEFQILTSISALHFKDQFLYAADRTGCRTFIPWSELYNQ